MATTQHQQGNRSHRRMSLVCAVEQAIESCKIEQAKVNDNIKHCREILQSLTLQLRTESEESESAEGAAKAAETSPGEKEDIELLERALEKALRVRTSSELSKKDSCRDKLSGARSETGITSDALILSAVAKEGQTTMRSTSMSARLDRKGHRKSGLSVQSTLSSRASASYKPAQSKSTNDRNIIQHGSSSSAQAAHHQAARSFQQTVLASALPDQITASFSKIQKVRGNAARHGDLSSAASVCVSVSDTDGSGSSRLLQQNGLQSEQTSRWKSLRNKQNRLWEKVISLHKKPVPGRSNFMERMRTTFPSDWPCGSPDQTRALLDRLIERGLNLAHCCQAEKILAKQTSEMEAELAGEQNKHDSCPTLERFQQSAAELQIFAYQVKKEWKAWDQWRPEGGCLCPTGANGVLGDGITPALPLTITYRTEEELQELERLRMSVALLQQEIHLEQALLDSLSPQFSSIVPGPRCLNPSILRDMYSLLGEGGERFPAIVLDSEG